jgi:pyrroloquinoline quinone biosynthesis protein B
MQTGLAVSAGDGRWTLINASPDLPAQIRATSALYPRDRLRGSPIQAVVLTGAEIDQIAGLLSLRESTPFALYATPASHAAVAANAMFGAMTSMARRAVNPGERFTLAGGIEARLFMVPGKLPLYLEDEAPELETESAANVGIELQRDGAKMVFVPGTATVTEQMLERFAGADVVLFDGTVFTDDEMIRTGTGQKTGRRMGHMQIDGDDGSLRALTGLSARRIYIHVNNTNPILVEGSAERRKVESAGWQVAEDGVEIVL